MPSITETPRTAKSRLKELELLSTIPELLTHHLALRPDEIIYQAYDQCEKRWQALSVKQVCETVTRWRHAFAARPTLVHGDRVAMLLPNSVEAVYFDLSALSNALVPVPLHAVDTPKSSAFILKDSGAKVLVTNKFLKWKQIRDIADLPDLELVVVTDDAHCDDLEAAVPVMTVKTFLEKGEGSTLPARGPVSTDLGALVYTSGTTGNPKGVMLTHRNVLANVMGLAQTLPFYEKETVLSYLPLSHTFERTTSYYMSLGLGFTVAFNRSIPNLMEDFRTIRPSVLMSVPRVYEMVYNKLRDGLVKKGRAAQYLFDWAVEVGWRRFCRENGLPVEPSARAYLDPLVADWLDEKIGRELRAVFGDNIHLYISGAAALSSTVAKTYLGLGVNILQGYGLTEATPVISVNIPGRNDPKTVGPALPNLEVRLGDGDELLVRGPTVMKGYWHREEATRETITEDGWLKTGDVCSLYKDGHIRITGRIKEIIVTSTGEKVPPTDLESAIESDRLFAQSMVLGEDRPFIAALCVVNPDEWSAVCEELGLEAADPASLEAPAAKRLALRRVKAATAGFPNYGVPRQVTLTTEPWTIDNGFLTPTMKKKRRVIASTYAKEIDAMYDTLAGKR